LSLPTKEAMTMSEQPEKIEGKCLCGHTVWNEMLWVVRVGKNGSGYCVQFGYCPDCGYYLDPNGFAHRMVRAERATKSEQALQEAIRLINLYAEGTYGVEMLHELAQKKQARAEAADETPD